MRARYGAVRTKATAYRSIGLQRGQADLTSAEKEGQTKEGVVYTDGKLG
jgi:hypothetical protein